MFLNLGMPDYSDLMPKSPTPKGMRHISIIGEYQVTHSTTVKDRRTGEMVKRSWPVTVKQGRTYMTGRWIPAGEHRNVPLENR